MLIDFQPVFDRTQTLGELAAGYGRADLGAALDRYVDFTREVINGVTDAQAAWIPVDQAADDPHAASEADRHAGWSLIHLVMHVTASAEEAAAFSSILARGIAISGRLRSERDWQQVTGCRETVGRLEECRRICHGYLSAWPDSPDLATVRIMPDTMAWMKPNAAVSFLAGLLHWQRHVEQLRRVADEARAAR